MNGITGNFVQTTYSLIVLSVNVNEYQTNQIFTHSSPSVLH